MRTPKDQGLFYAIFFGIAAAAIIFFWIMIPAVSPHLHDEEEEEVSMERLNRQDTIYQAEHILKQAGEKLTELEAQAEEQLKEEK